MAQCQLLPTLRQLAHRFRVKWFSQLSTTNERLSPAERNARTCSQENSPLFTQLTHSSQLLTTFLTSCDIACQRMVWWLFGRGRQSHNQSTSCELEARKKLRDIALSSTSFKGFKHDVPKSWPCRRQGQQWIRAAPAILNYQRSLMLNAISIGRNRGLCNWLISSWSKNDSISNDASKPQDWLEPKQY